MNVAIPIIAVVTILGAGGYGLYLFGPRRKLTPEQEEQEQAKAKEKTMIEAEGWKDLYGVRPVNRRWKATAPEGEISGYTVSVNPQIIFGTWKEIGTGWDPEEIVPGVDRYIRDFLGP